MKAIFFSTICARIEGKDNLVGELDRKKASEQANSKLIRENEENMSTISRYFKSSTDIGEWRKTKLKAT